MPRKRGGNKHQRGLPIEQRPVLTPVTRGGETRAQVLLNTRLALLRETMGVFTTKDAIVVSDGHKSYGASCPELGRSHEVVQRIRWKIVAGWHLNTVNNRHSRMKATLNSFRRGVATKYLDNYLHWLSMDEFRPNKKNEVDFSLINLTLKHI